MPETFDFDRLRRQAMLASPNDPLVKELAEDQWADFGRRVHANLLHERFVRQLVLALMACEGQPEPQLMIASKLRAYLVTGALS